MAFRSNGRHARIVLAALVISACSMRCQAAPDAAKPSSTENLGSQLLDDDALRQLLDGAKQYGARQEQDGNTLPSERQPSLLPDVDKLRELVEPKKPAIPDGEDLGQPSGSPLVRISNRMAQASELIETQSTDGETTAVQQEIVTELDKLIEQLSKQCSKCSGSCNKPGTQQTQSSTPKPGQGKKPSKPGAQSPPQQSTVNAGGESAAQPGEMTDSETVKQLWGQLPERLRQQLLQSSADEFLPKYREELEQYFRRLAEEQSDGANGQ
jgi:hypothetical protein